MTEDKAKMKWCPFSRQAVAASREPAILVTANRDGKEHYGVDNVNCMGNSCMAWRFYSIGDEDCSLLRK